MTSFILLSKMFRFLFIPLIIKLNTSVKLLSNLFFFFCIFRKYQICGWFSQIHGVCMQEISHFFRTFLIIKPLFLCEYVFLCDVVNQELVSFISNEFSKHFCFGSEFISRKVFNSVK